MALDRLAPDQRAVVQLVLQQERSYDELSDLLGIPTEAVRERARKGLERIDQGAALDEGDRGRITDFLLGQQSVSGREATRAILTENAAAREWARTVATELSEVARSPLPDLPAGAPAPEPVAPAVATPAVEPEPATTLPGPAPESAPDVLADRPVRARPRPRPKDERARRPAPGPRPSGERPRSSLLGGALLIGGVALVVVALVVWLVVGDSDDGERSDETVATPTATATGTPQPAGQIQLRQPGGGDATGQMTIFISQDGEIAFTIEGENMPELDRGEAYAMWLVGGDRPRRLGFITDENPDDARIGSSGPQEGDAQRFPQWLADARNVVVTRETSQDAAEPGPVVLRGAIPGAGSG